MDSIRTSLAFFNARRSGLPFEVALDTARRWRKNCQRLFSQSKAAEIFESDVFDISQMPESIGPDELLLTAHYSAYTSLLIAVSKRYNRPISVVIGNHPQEFVGTLRQTCAKAGVDADAIRSTMRILRHIDEAKAEGRIISALFDVPWHRDAKVQRPMAAYAFGAGRITASPAIFDLAQRAKMRTHLTLCTGNDGARRIRFIADATQADCFSQLTEAAMQSPDQFERLCELHKYFDGVEECQDATLFKLQERVFMVSGPTRKSYELSPSVAESVSDRLRCADFSGAAEQAIEALNAATKIEHRACALI